MANQSIPAALAAALLWTPWTTSAWARPPEPAPAPAPTVTWATAYLMTMVMAEDDEPGLEAGDGAKPVPAPRTPARDQRGRFARGVFATRGWRLQVVSAVAGGRAKTPKKAVAVAPEGVLPPSAWEDAAAQDRWSRLSAAFAVPEPECPHAADDAQRYASEVQLLTPPGGGQGEHGGADIAAVLAPLRGWSLQRLQCLAFAMVKAHASAPEASNMEPLPLLLALRQSGVDPGRDQVLQTLFAARLLARGHYGECLDVLLALMDQEPDLRLAYDLVQGIYSRHQVGGGGVALQGL